MNSLLCELTQFHNIWARAGAACMHVQLRCWTQSTHKAGPGSKIKQSSDERTTVNVFVDTCRSYGPVRAVGPGVYSTSRLVQGWEPGTNLGAAGAVLGAPPGRLGSIPTFGGLGGWVGHLEVAAWPPYVCHVLTSYIDINQGTHGLRLSHLKRSFHRMAPLQHMLFCVSCVFYCFCCRFFDYLVFFSFLLLFFCLSCVFYCFYYCSLVYLVFL